MKPLPEITSSNLSQVFIIVMQATFATAILNLRICCLMKLALSKFQVCQVEALTKQDFGLAALHNVDNSSQVLHTRYLELQELPLT